MNARATVFGLWKRQLLYWLVSFVVGLVVCLFLVFVLRVRPRQILSATGGYGGLRPYHEAALKAGLDIGLLIVINNCIASLVPLLCLLYVLLLDPDRASQFPSGLRRYLIRESSKESKLEVRLLGVFKKARAIPVALLHSVYVFLDLLPRVPIILIGLLLGTYAALTYAMLGSFLIFILLVAPHSILEIPGLALGGALVRTGYHMVHEDAMRGETAAVFEKLRAYSRARAFRVGILVVIVLLTFAGMIEGHVTPLIAARFGYG